MVMMMRVAVFVAVLMVVIVVMAVRMIVTVRMIMVMIVMMMIVIVLMAVTNGIGAFRLERRFDRLELRSEGLQRLFERRIATKAQAIFLYLDRDVAVAEVPRQSRERHGIFDAHFEERFGFRDDLHKAAIVEQQCVVGAKAHGFRKIKFDARAFHAEEKSALRLSLRECQNERVDDAAGFAFG
jgi:hypothetical protein